MKVRYLYNSGFIIESEKYIFIIDSMYKTEIENRKNKKIICLATHSHHDHFNDFILKEGFCILSDDIKIKNKKDNIMFVKEYDEINIEDIKIKTFSSTDLGVSYLIETDKKLIFHSGDLNWWYWENDSEETKEKEGNDYKREILKLKEYLKGRTLDIAFIPVDRRLKENSILAIDFFLKNIKTKNVFPMHFMDNYEYINDLEKIIKKYKDVNINIINKRNQKFDL
ncbi:MBL fold metallo-hydrolase [Anaerofustis sp.]|uniref:MBL fold metallo-hydrolase n=1 Tax=Anaerofustis sp. TaxID=1872517 RepID=UPI0025C208A7|nr:MBL fold metallo-hydrolase [Anaerofustis sp.]